MDLNVLIASQFVNCGDSESLVTHDSSHKLGELHWELGGPLGTLKIPTQMLSYKGMNNQPLHLAKVDFSSTKVLSVGNFFGGYPSNFVNCKMGLCEWMAWMWSAHDHTPFTHSVSVTWVKL